MLYLSRLLLNLRSRHARQDLADVQHLHRTILGAFPAAPNADTARQHFGILFRAEPVADQPLVVRVLVQSIHQPDWSRLVPGYLAPAPDARPNPAVRVLDGEYEQLANGLTLRFRLRANPTKRISKNDPEQKKEWHGKRVELRDETDQIAWLQRKADHGGFRLLTLRSDPRLADVRISPQAKVVGDRRTASKMTFGAAVFEGLLEVQNVERFRQTLIDGIGSGKAYGFGLLSIATLRGEQA
jgi:CRISPR system Cascade subunit CasE